jgi:hypothetical protein
MDVCVYSVCRQRPCIGLIPRPRCPTKKIKKIKKMKKSGQGSTMGCGTTDDDDNNSNNNNNIIIIMNKTLKQKHVL